MRKELSYAYGTDYAINTPTREGFTPDVLTVTGKADGAAHEYVVTYTANPTEETEAPAETQPVAEEEGSTASAVFAIVIMVVVLIAIGVGAFLLFRSDKKTAKKGSAAKNAQTKKKNGK